MGGEPLLAVLLRDGGADDRGARAFHAVEQMDPAAGAGAARGVAAGDGGDSQGCRLSQERGAASRQCRHDGAGEEDQVPGGQPAVLHGHQKVDAAVQALPGSGAPELRPGEPEGSAEGERLYGRARQYKRMGKEVKRLRTFLGRVVRESRNNLASMPPACRAAMDQLLPKLERLHAQDKHSKHKLYSLHSPEVECIGKGKPHKHYEFGNKTGVVTTNKLGWVRGMMALHGNPYDGHSFAPCVEQAMRVSQVKVSDAYVDRGYRGAMLSGVRVHRPGDRNASRGERKRLGRRAHLEATIGFMKNKGKLCRNRLHGPDGNRRNALLCGIARNISLLLARLDGSSSFLSRFCARLLQLLNDSWRVGTSRLA